MTEKRKKCLFLNHFLTTKKKVKKDLSGREEEYKFPLHMNLICCLHFFPPLSSPPHSYFLPLPLSRATHFLGEITMRVWTWKWERGREEEMEKGCRSKMESQSM